jgi:hypothetical protein
MVLHLRYEEPGQARRRRMARDIVEWVLGD